MLNIQNMSIMQNMSNMQNMQNMQNKSYIVSKIFDLDLRRILAALLPTRNSSSSSSMSAFPAVRGTAAGAAVGSLVAMVRPYCCARCWGGSILAHFAGSKRFALPSSSSWFSR
jgi:hypothetical protein